MSFLSKIFGGKKKEDDQVETLIKSSLDGLIERAQFDLSFKIKSDVNDKGEPTIFIEFEGLDEELLKEQEGQVIDSLQLFLKRVVQHNFPEDRSDILIDCNGYREETNQQLVELAEKLKGIALEKGKSVYFRALPPKDRKIIHQYLSGDERVKSRSIGDGLYKKIKVYPVKNNGNQASVEAAD